MNDSPESAPESNNSDSRVTQAVPRGAFWYCSQMLLRFVCAVWFRYRARGFEKIPRQGGVMLLVNHQSFLDPILAGLPMSRPVSYMARDSLFRIPVLNWMMRHNHAVPISRSAASAQSIRTCVDYLKGGRVVGIFPEGTRSRELQRLRPGFVSIAKRAGCSIVPVGVSGSWNALPRGSWFIRPAKIRVVFGDPLDPDQIAALIASNADPDLLSVVTDQLQTCVGAADAWRTNQPTASSETSNRA